MRRWAILLLELLAVGAIAALVLLGIGRFNSPREASASDRAFLVVDPIAAPFEPPPVEIATTPAGTFQGIKDELLLERIHSGEIAEAKLNKGGSSLSFRLQFTDGTRAAFKPLQINPQSVPRKEVAAYRLDRLLGMNRVPPAMMRTLHRDELVGKLPTDALFQSARIDAETIFDSEGFTRGEVSFWIPTIIDTRLDAPEAMVQWTRWLTAGEPIPRDRADLLSQLSSLLVLDLLTNNSDRFSGGNLMGSPDGRTLYYMDNTFGFQIDPEGNLRCRNALQRVQKFSRRLVGALRLLDRASIRGALERDPGVLTEDEIGAVLHRRDWALRYIDGLVARFGERRVLAFP